MSHFRNHAMPVVRWCARPMLFAAMLALLVATSAAAQDGISLAVVPDILAAAPGDTVEVALQVTVAGDVFNAYAATVVFDPLRLELLPVDPLSDQEGPLMVGACSDRFHQFAAADDGASAQIDHGLLCAGVSVDGPGTIYRLRFLCLDTDGETEIGLAPQTSFYDAGAFVTPVELAGATILIDETVSVDDGGEEAAVRELPRAAALAQNAPNPFNPSTVIRFATATAGQVSLEVFDLRGQRIGVLVDGPRAAGEHEVVFDGRGLASGTYVYRLATNDRVATRSMQLVK
ncbi:T9SS type A sorting domain-containing protein [bacterium]|nr:T9SS type A sorting domain-containing protein [bacterium]